MSAQLQLGHEHDELAAVAPFTGDCPRCHGPVLVVEIDGQDVVLEPEEILKTLRCPRCAGNLSQGNEQTCWRCGGTRMVGEELPSIGVAVAADGRARRYSGRRREGEAIMRPHVCVTP